MHTFINSKFSSFQSSSSVRNFLNYSEFENLKIQGEALDNKIKIRREYETQYHHLKLSQTEKELDEIKFKNQIANKRNDELLNSLQKDIYNCYQFSKITSYSKNLKEKETKKYSEYLSYQMSNIRNEFKFKLLAKQNEFQGIKTVLENQFSHNEKVLKMEDEYSIKMARMNEELANKIRNLHEKNKEVDEDRKNLMQNFEIMEEKSRENFVKIFEEEKKIDDARHKQDVGRINQSHEAHIQEIIKKLKIKFDEENKPNNETLDNKQDLINNVKSNKNNYTLNNSISNANLASNTSNISSVNVKISKLKNNSENNLSKVTKRFSHKDGALDNLRLKKKEKEREKSIIENSDPRDNYSSIDMSMSKDNNIDINTNNYTNLKTKTYFENIRNKSKISNKMSLFEEEFDIPENKIEINLNSALKIKSIDKPNISDKVNKGDLLLQKSNSNDFLTLRDKSENIIEINTTPNFNTNTNLNATSSKTIIPPIDKKSQIEFLLETKPDLSFIPKELKLTVVVKIISQIEKNIKGVKPNTPNSYVYQPKHMVSASKQSFKSKFYEIFTLINDVDKPKTSDIPIPNTNTDTLIHLLLEIINSNSSPNLNRDNLMGMDYDELTLNKDIDKNIKEIFDLVAEHMKKVVIDRKTSPHMAANVLASSLMNFEKDQRITSNLVAVLERKLSQKAVTSQIGMMTGGWGGGKFKSNISLKLIIGSNSGNVAMKSLVSDSKRDGAYNTASNFNVKSRDNNGGIINDFTEIE